MIKKLSLKIKEITRFRECRNRKFNRAVCTFGLLTTFGTESPLSQVVIDLIV